MSFGAILDSLLFKPLQLIFEIIYMIAYRLIGNPALAIIILSLVMNFLVLPLYRRADAMQEEERDMEAKLHKGVSHIKKTFKGDERMMILQTYYRQNHYKPTYVLRGAISLFLEIPFFIAAYRFLSELKLLNGVSFGPIADLGKPDGLLVIAGITVNVLPFLMTAINLVSCVIFTKGSTLKSKIQLYAMALFFLVFLYTSPAGLVFYWTLNNTFSLVKTIFYKLKNPGRVLGVIFSAGGILLLVYGLFFYPNPTAKRTLFFVCIGILFQLPLLFSLLKGKMKGLFSGKEQTGNKKTFFAGAVFLSVLTGVLIPSSVIKASPQEFVDISYFYHPIWFVVSAFCLAFGLFVIWMGVFYWLAKPAARAFFDKAVWILAVTMTVNYMFFGKNLGILSSALKFENGLDFGKKEQLINAAILFVLAALLYFVALRFKKQIFDLLLIGAVALVGMSAFNIVSINQSVNAVKADAIQQNGEPASFSLSKDGKNVVVLMLDRAMGQYLPYIFNEKPELKESFSGFTAYTNVLSHGGSTNFGVPALLGGYEYTPFEMNKRDTELLGDKHNEALKVMPVLFGNNGYKVTVCDPPYAGYRWVPDLSIYDDYPDINRYITKGNFSNLETTLFYIENNKRNFFCYSLVKTMPLLLQETLYDRGNYNTDLTLSFEDTGVYTGQTTYGLSKAEGIDGEFMQDYNVLLNLPNITQITNDDTNTFLFMANELPHHPMLLQEPDYIPLPSVDNTEYDSQHEDRFTVNGRRLIVETEAQITHYQSNMACLLQIAKWMDFLRESDVYDNTRIILVADHGTGLCQNEELIIDPVEDGAHFFPLLMVKDFDSEEFRFSDEFMTNGDVPTLATDNLIQNPVNPFTGKEINSDAKNQPQYVISSSDWDILLNNGTTFFPANWYSVHDSIWDRSNWSLVAQNTILPTK